MCDRRRGHGSGGAASPSASWGRRAAPAIRRASSRTQRQFRAGTRHHGQSRAITQVSHNHRTGGGDEACGGVAERHLARGRAQRAVREREGPVAVAAVAEMKLPLLLPLLTHASALLPQQLLVEAAIVAYQGSAFQEVSEGLRALLLRMKRSAVSARADEENRPVRPVLQSWSLGSLLIAWQSLF